MTGEGPSRPVSQEATYPVGTSLGPLETVSLWFCTPLVDWGNPPDPVVLSPLTHLLGGNQTHLNGPTLWPCRDLAGWTRSASQTSHVVLQRVWGHR